MTMVGAGSGLTTSVVLVVVTSDHLVATLDDGQSLMSLSRRNHQVDGVLSRPVLEVITCP